MNGISVDWAGLKVLREFTPALLQFRPGRVRAVGVLFGATFVVRRGSLEPLGPARGTLCVVSVSCARSELTPVGTVRGVSMTSHRGPPARCPCDGLGVDTTLNDLHGLLRVGAGVAQGQ